MSMIRKNRNRFSLRQTRSVCAEIMFKKKGISKLALASLLLIAGAAGALAATEADYKAAYSAAEAVNKEAGALRNQWTTTASMLAAAKKAADAGDFDKAVEAAKEAEALAKASIYQAKSEKELWKDLEIR
jgi:hypothetical protein